MSDQQQSFPNNNTSMWMRQSQSSITTSKSNNMLLLGNEEGTNTITNSSLASATATPSEERRSFELRDVKRSGGDSASQVESTYCNNLSQVEKGHHHPVKQHHHHHHHHAPKPPSTKAKKIELAKKIGRVVYTLFLLAVLAALIALDVITSPKNAWISRGSIVIAVTLFGRWLYGRFLKFAFILRILHRCCSEHLKNSFSKFSMSGFWNTLFKKIRNQRRRCK